MDIRTYVAFHLGGTPSQETGTSPLAVYSSTTVYIFLVIRFLFIRSSGFGLMALPLINVRIQIKLVRKPINGSYCLDNNFFQIYRGHIFDTKNIDTVNIFEKVLDKFDK